MEIYNARLKIVPMLLALALVMLALASTPSAYAVGTERVSVDSAGVQVNMDSSAPAVSVDGRYIAFESAATNLVAGDVNAATDIYVRDRVTGTTERVSVDSGGAEANNNSLSPAISADGRYVAFESRATNLVGGDTNTNRDIFVRDRVGGTTERVSVDSAGLQANDNSNDPAISADGRYVAFMSAATNLAAGDANAVLDIFVRDLQASTTERISVDSSEVEANGNSSTPSVSGDGRYVAFASLAINLVASDTNAFSDVFVRDRQAGVTERASLDTAEAEGNLESFAPSISADGRYVAFQSAAFNLAPGDSNSADDVFVRDRQDGTTGRMSVSSSESEADSLSGSPSISGDGRTVAFFSYATNLVASDTNSAIDVFVRHQDDGTTERMSVGGAGVEGNSASAGIAISANGHMTAFHSGASNLVADDTNAVYDVFVRAPDSDSDTVADDADNCPEWPNTGQGLPTWLVPAGDSDCDGFPDSVTASGRGNEIFITTAPFSQCPLTTATNDEAVDAWPPDLNDSKTTNLSDVSLMSPAYNKTIGQAGYSPRMDLNASNVVNLSDISVMSASYNKSCTP